MMPKSRATTMAADLGERTGGDATGTSKTMHSSETELERQNLRQRWELASVLNFINVFEPVIGSSLKTSAEEIEMALIKSNSLLTKLHVTLLKGIPPVSKTLDYSDAWVALLCKKLSMRWPRLLQVAKGEFPLAVAKGEEICRYKELDPTTRLVILKALCEIRADQNDIISYINDAIKNGSSISTFRKEKIGGDENGISYWYDGDPTIGFRFYKEVNKFKRKLKVIGEETMSIFNCRWETLATNINEFRKLTDELSSSKVKMEVTVGKALETNAIPALEKLQKKKERVLKRQQRQQMLLNGFQSSGITRSGRNRKPISYTFDEYDKAIDNAIRIMKEKKTIEEPRCEQENNSRDSETETLSARQRNEENIEKWNNSRDSESTETETMSERSGYEDNSDYECNVSTDDSNDRRGSGSSNSEKDGNNQGKWKQGPYHSQSPNGNCIYELKGLHESRGLARNGKRTLPEGRSPSAKNRLRQRPTRNTAIESNVDSEDGNLSENISNDIRGCKISFVDDVSLEDAEGSKTSDES